MENRNVILGQNYLESLLKTRKKLCMTVFILFLALFCTVLVDVLFYSSAYHTFFLILTIAIFILFGWVIIYIMTMQVFDLNRRISLIERSKNTSPRILKGYVKSISSEDYTIYQLICKRMTFLVDNQEIFLYYLIEFDLQKLIESTCELEVFNNIILSYEGSDV